MNKLSTAHRKKIDFAKINAAALPNLASILPEFFPNGRREGNQFRIGSLDGEKGNSLGVSLTGPKAGMWKDFNAGDKGGDIISLIAAARGLRQGEAARLLAHMLRL
jgi:hypothetical protein